MKNQHQNNIKQMLYNSHLIKESNQRKSRQTRTLRAFCLASSSLCAALIIDLLFVDFSVIG